MKNIQINEQERKRILGMHKQQLNEQPYQGPVQSPKENVAEVFKFCTRNWAGVAEKYNQKATPFDHSLAVTDLNKVPNNDMANGITTVINKYPNVFSTLPDICSISHRSFNDNLFNFINDRARFDSGVWKLLNGLLTKGGAFKDMDEFVPELNKLRAKTGSPSTYVRQIQEKLKELGYELTADNSLGPKTFAALSEVLSNPCNKKVSVKNIRFKPPTDEPDDDDFDRPIQ